jgi:hypothetical protein
MKQVYNRSFTVVWSTGDSGYVLSDRIEPGYVLHVLSCCAYSAQREASDDVVIGIRNGGEDIPLTAQAPLAAQMAVNTPTDFVLGEGDQVFAYFPDADNADSIALHINGELIDLSSWESTRR